MRRRSFLKNLVGTGLLGGIESGDVLSKLPNRSSEQERTAQRSKLFLESLQSHDGIGQTGIYDLDQMLHGIRRGDLIAVGGRPSMGKTSFALNVAKSFLLTDNQPVIIFSMEMFANRASCKSRESEF